MEWEPVERPSGIISYGHRFTRSLSQIPCSSRTPTSTSTSTRTRGRRTIHAEEGRLRMGIGLGVRLQAGGEGKAAFAPGFNGLERPALEDSFFTGLLGLFSSPRPIYSRWSRSTRDIHDLVVPCSDKKLCEFSSKKKPLRNGQYLGSICQIQNCNIKYTTFQWDHS